ncbi:MAG: DUF4263 domain-containing protein [Limnohabitans sp.]|nr:DUF4263 domain-containing protein [Limnohabitans sp.]
MIEFTENTTYETEIILNSRLENLYNHEFEKGRFFQVVFSDDHNVDIRLSSRTLMKVVYIRDNDDIEGIEIVKIVAGEEKGRVKFNKFNFQQLKSFLDFISSIDLKGITDRRIVLSDDTLDVLDAETKRKITTLLSGGEGSEIIKKLLNEGIITGQDLVNTGYRKQQLELFEKLLNDNYLDTYKIEINKPNTKDETAWQHFFMKNPWIFGYGLDYKFQGILQKEFHASDTDADGSDGVISDFLLGDKKFTTFVELKLPETELFGTIKNRSNSWTLSNKLIGAYTQILEQKSSGIIKIETTKTLYDDKKEPITNRAYDSKTILIIGNWKEVDNSDDKEGIKQIKRKTFELFRRDSRNIEIITYDELFDRAKFIVLNENYMNDK